MKLNYLIDLGLYMLFGMGIVLYFYNDIDLAIARFRLRHRLRAVKVESKPLPFALDYIYKLIDTSFENNFSKRLFILFEALLYIISYALSYKNFNPLIALVVSTISITLPILLLAAKLEASRAKASREGISLVSEVHRQYRMNNLNIYVAIEKACSVDANYSLSSKLLYSLLIRLRSACGPVEISEAINRFVFSYGTSWAKMFGQCIKLSALNGTNVSAGLNDIVSQLRDANSLEEKRKMLNSEASRMTLFLVPIMYLICFITSVLYLKINPVHLIENQFFNPKGFLLFLLCVFLFLFNLFLLNLISNDKLDF